MEELYPGETDGAVRAFHIKGNASVLSATGVSQTTNTDTLITGFHWFGRQNLFVRHQNGAAIPQQPSFDFQLLTAEFLVDIIHSDPAFQFSLVSKRIGDVTYISGAAARDYGGDVRQGIVSLHATGAMGADGLKFNFKGELGDQSALRDKPSEFRNASYELSLDIPWSILRFMFFSEVGFMNNYRTFQKAAP